MTRRILAWLAVLAGIATCLWILRAHFSQAFPIVALRITADRASVLKQAEEMALKYGWGPQGARLAATFRNGDHVVQFFTELEGGGKGEFARVLGEGLYHPFQWQVRLFRPLVTNETTVSFTPAGEPYGFDETIPENQPGASLEPEAARLIAERAATNDWRVPMAAFHLVESSRESMPGGRVDHTFVYERTSERLGEGRYRLALKVSGDRLTHLHNFVKVPDAFVCRYTQMRSANHAIASGADFVIYLGYGLGTIFAFILLLRRRALAWRKALAWALVVSTLGLMARLASLPLIWMHYDTMQPESVFMARYVAGIVFSWAALSIMLTLIFSVAEGLTRLCLPRQLQFWKLWSPAVAARPAVFWMTAGGYGMALLFLAILTLIYAAGQRHLGWWAPLSQLVSPDIVALPCPWLAPLAGALEAGFMEECLFRAIPLAGMIGIGRALGLRRGWLALAVVLQAVIFGAGHADYPQQPAYVRVVEIFPMAVVFGLVYLRFGLLPVVIAHFAFDMALMSLPLFVTRVPYIWVDQVLAAALALAPLWVVAAARLRKGSVREHGEDCTNAAWIPPPVSPRPAAEAAPGNIAGRSLTRLHLATAAVLGAAGLAAWALAARSPSWSGRLCPGRTEAVAIAREALSKNGMAVGPDWRAQAEVEGSAGLAERYAWRTAGTNGFRLAQSLDYLDSLAWSIRFVRFDEAIDVAERAESFTVGISGTGRVTRIRHSIPEKRPGKNQVESEARETAGRALKGVWPERFPAVKEISVSPDKRPARTDWSFVFCQTNCPGFTNQELRLGVSVVDGGVAGYGAYCKVPEDWADRETREQAQYILAEMICRFILIALGVFMLVVMLITVSRGAFRWRPALALFLIAAGLGLGDAANSWISELAGFSPVRPYSHQVFTACLGGFVALLLPALGAGFLGGYVAGTMPAPERSRLDIPVALAWSAALAGFDDALGLIGPSLEPAWSSAAALEKYFPWAVPFTSDIFALLLGSLMLMALLSLAAPLARGKRKWIVAALIVLLSIASAGSSVETWRQCAAEAAGSSLLWVVVYFQVLRRRPDLAPLVLAGMLAMNLISNAVDAPYAGAASSSVSAAAAVLGLALAWRLFPARAPRTGSGPGAGP
ncbi:MAG: type II CAAX endopeptidase family protein [Kiritimatiellia bacterium]